jgi:hypothetical protein
LFLKIQKAFVDLQYLPSIKTRKGIEMKYSNKWNNCKFPANVEWNYMGWQELLAYLIRQTIWAKGEAKVPIVRRTPQDPRKFLASSGLVWYQALYMWTPASRQRNTATVLYTKFCDVNQRLIWNINQFLKTCVQKI